MLDKGNRKRIKKPRIAITTRELKQLAALYGTASASRLAKRTGLPYLLLYNLLRGRTRTIKSRDYLTLFGKAAPPQVSLKVDGTKFRTMAALWLFLNSDVTKTELYRDLLGLEKSQAADLRPFSGKVSTVDAKLEHRMREKFSDQGVDGTLLHQWLDDFEKISTTERIPYAKVQPILAKLSTELDVHPTSLLNQSVTLYENGVLSTVSRDAFRRLQKLQEKVDEAIARQPKGGVEKIRESVFGVKPGYTLYSDIKEELIFLRDVAGKSVKAYLGRSLWTYEKGSAKRIANWRAEKIVMDCDQFIRSSPFIRLSDLPPFLRQRHTRMLIGTLMARAGQLLSEKEGIDFEKRVLRPWRSRDAYTGERHSFTPFEMAPRVLGMKRRAFDLMVAKNCEIFRTISRFNKRWYLPDRYLNELVKKESFGLVSAKYELLAEKRKRSQPVNDCLM